MVSFTKHRLDNGLTVLHHHDKATRMVAVNSLYNVGSSDELPPLTGLAHLLEHLMFTGSRHVVQFDQTLQAAGGQSNAWTSVDATNYYIVLPAPNLETALWLESDRLLHLTLSDESIATQKSVVIEEFKQRSLNAPYGDLSHLLGALAYTRHPYGWPPIGRTIEDVERATADDVRSFHQQHYQVNNLIVCISGNVDLDRALQSVERWYGDIPTGHCPQRHHTEEPPQQHERRLEVERNVPQSVVCRAYHMCGRNHPHYPALDILSDVLSNGKSSRFYKNLLLATGLFSHVDASVSGTLDNGLFHIRGRLAPQADTNAALDAIDNELQRLLREGITDYELEKYVNKHVSASRFESIGYLQQAMRLCLFEQQGDVSLVNDEEQLYHKLTTDDIAHVAATTLRAANCSTLIYRAQP